jgi:hypothetical protein
MFPFHLNGSWCASRARLAKDLKRRCGLSDELSKGVCSRVFERRPIKIGPYASPLRETSDGRCDAVRRRDSTGAEGRTGEIKGRDTRKGLMGWHTLVAVVAQ